MSNDLQIDKVDQKHLSKKGNFVASLCPYWLKKLSLGDQFYGMVLFCSQNTKPNQIVEGWMDGIVEGWMDGIVEG